MDTKVKAESYTLRTDSGQWLGQVVITDDGMLASVTDWGNLSYAWRSYGKDNSFKEFLCSIRVDYFASKLYQGISYTASSKKIEASCKRYAENILPALQEALTKELKK